MAKGLIDFGELLARTEKDRELMRDLLSIFKEEFPRRHQALREAAQAAAQLERLGRNKEPEKFRECFALFESIAKELFRQIEATMGEASG